MARFNSAKRSSVQTVRNKEGAQAYLLSPEVRLYALVCNSLLQDEFYKRDGAKEIRLLIPECKPQFVANLASYARNEMNLRSVPIPMVTQLCRETGGSLSRRAVARVIKRADEITEILSQFAEINKANHKKVSVKNHCYAKEVAKIPRSLVKGVRDVFESGRFDEYQYSKYQAKGKRFRMKDALFLTRPHPKNERQTALFAKIANSTLQAADTWQKRQMDVARKAKTENLSNDQKKELKLDGWLSMIESRKLGHMALLRNLDNMLTLKPTDEQLNLVMRELVRGASKGKQFPFRYWSAYKELMGIQLRSWHIAKDGCKHDPFIMQAVVEALESALMGSIKSYPSFQGRSLVACDVSGSMAAEISDKSTIWRLDVGLVMGGLLKKHLGPKAITGLFGDEFKIVPKVENVLSFVEDSYRRMGEVGYATYGYKVLDYLVRKNVEVDNVMFFTDCQVYGSRASGQSGGANGGNEMEKLWHRYKRSFPKARLILFDLSGYGNVPIKVDGHDVIHVAGFSDRIFETLDHMVHGEAIVDYIMAYNK